MHPSTITRNQAEIQALLDRVDYVSPGRTGTPLYLVTYRSCTQCRAFEEQEFPKFDAANVDTRVVVFAPTDSQGLRRSSTAERSTIAELWISRNWQVYQAWFASSDANWKATGLTVADNDFARSAVVDASRSFVTQLQPLLAANNVRLAYPLVIWRDQNNMLKVCSCSDEKAYHFIREDLNAPGSVNGGPVFQIPENLLPSFGSESAAASHSSAAPVPAPAPAPVAAAPAPAPKPVAQAKPAAAQAKNASGYATDFGPGE